MFIVATAKNNLLATFKARFSLNNKGEGYLFYPKEYDEGYSCSEEEYLKFTSNFQKFLKFSIRSMWLWFLVGMPIFIGLAVWQEYELNNLEIITIIALPLPFLVFKGWKVYNPPTILTLGKRPASKRRNQKEIMDARISGMSWLMLTAIVALPIVASYVFLTNNELAEWQVALGLSFFSALFIFGAYLIFRKFKL